MATRPDAYDGYVLSPVSEAVSLYTAVAGEYGWEGTVAPVSFLWVPGRQLISQSLGLDGTLV